LGSFVRARIIALGAGSASYDRRRAVIAAGSSWKSSFGQEQALAKTTPASVKNTRRYRPEDKLLAFLKGL